MFYVFLACLLKVKMNPMSQIIKHQPSFFNAYTTGSLRFNTLFIFTLTPLCCRLLITLAVITRKTLPKKDQYFFLLSFLWEMHLVKSCGLLHKKPYKCTDPDFVVTPRARTLSPKSLRCTPSSTCILPLPLGSLPTAGAEEETWLKAPLLALRLGSKMLGVGSDNMARSSWFQVSQQASPRQLFAPILLSLCLTY